jgi:hypothetical protein
VKHVRPHNYDAHTARPHGHARRGQSRSMSAAQVAPSRSRTRPSSAPCPTRPSAPGLHPGAQARGWPSCVGPPRGCVYILSTHILAAYTGGPSCVHSLHRRAELCRLSGCASPASCAHREARAEAREELVGVSLSSSSYLRFSYSPGGLYGELYERAYITRYFPHREARAEAREELVGVPAPLRGPHRPLPRRLAMGDTVILHHRWL